MYMSRSAARRRSSGQLRAEPSSRQAISSSGASVICFRERVSSPSMRESDSPSAAASARQATAIASIRRGRASGPTSTKRQGRLWWGAGAARAAAMISRTIVGETSRGAKRRIERRGAMASSARMASCRSRRDGGDEPLRDADLAQKAVGGGLRRASQELREVAGLIDIAGQRGGVQGAGGQATRNRFALVEDGRVAAIAEGDHVRRAQGEGAGAAGTCGADGNAARGPGVEEGFD